jgi:uncharacterized Ntn-hydrolase superfamily protein
MLRRGTYSIVARDPATGEVGAAVQSHWFSTGSIVTWAQPGVGAVCTQSVAEPSYGPDMLERMAAGTAPAPALDALLAADEQRGFRQVAAVSAAGEIAVHTGDGCIPFAGHQPGDGFSCQANMMASDAVWPAMAAAFTATEGPLARRLLAALDGAEGAGGDVRGRQSAALVVAPAAGEHWRKTVDLRVDDHPEPLDELRRLLDLHDAYTLASEGDDLSGKGRHDEAADAYRRSGALAPESHELMFWAGLSAFALGDHEEGLAAVRRAIALQPGWAELLPRLSPEIAPSAAAVATALGLA